MQQLLGVALLRRWDVQPRLGRQGSARPGMVGVRHGAERAQRSRRIEDGITAGRAWAAAVRAAFVGPWWRGLGRHSRGAAWDGVTSMTKARGGREDVMLMLTSRAFLAGEALHACHDALAGHRRPARRAFIATAKEGARGAGEGVNRTIITPSVLIPRT
jgi:hypothetical protein